MRNLFLFLVCMLLVRCKSNDQTSAKSSADSASQASGLSTCTPNIVSSKIAVAIVGQLTDYWCWAASGQMCMSFLGTNITQCQEANDEFGMTDCCSSKTPTQCANGGWPDFPKYGFSVDTALNYALSFDEIKRQIDCLHKPVAFSWHWLDGDGNDDGSGHMMVVSGYQIIEGVPQLQINDPLPVNQGSQYTITYNYFVSGINHTHWNDFYNISKK